LNPQSLVPGLPIIPRRRYNVNIGEIASSLPVAIGVPAPKSLNPGYSLEPKTSLVERQGVLVPPLPRIPSSASDRARGTGNRRKSISSVARDRTYAARDIQRSKDPGEALGVPEVDDEDEEEIMNGEGIAINGSTNGLADPSLAGGAMSIREQGRRNAYRILQRQSVVP
jgi:hypothetical protein